MINLKATNEVPLRALVPADFANMDDLKSIFGRSSLDDAIPFTLSCGSVLFDIYTRLTPIPNAPLAREKEQTRRNDLAIMLDGEEFEIDEDLLEKLKVAFSDDSVWSTLPISARFENSDGQRAFVSLGADALYLFPTIKDALLKACT